MNISRNLYIEVEVYGGASVPKAIADMVALANRLGICVWADLNGVSTLSRPRDSADEILAAWKTAKRLNYTHASAPETEP